MSRIINIVAANTKGDMRTMDPLRNFREMTLISGALGTHDFPESPSEERMAAMIWYITEKKLDELEELMMFINEELSEMVDEAWEATADADSDGR